jgi:hypothetical protein
MGACGEGVSAVRIRSRGSSFFQMVLSRHTCGGRVRFWRWCSSTTGARPRQLVLRNDAFKTQSNARSLGGNLKKQEKTISAGGFPVPVRFAKRRIEDTQRIRGSRRAFESFAKCNA